MIFDIIKRESPVMINKGHDFSDVCRELRADARPSEEFAFQIAVLADDEITDLSIGFSDLRGKSDTIPAENFFCINFGGIDYKGIPFEKKLSLGKGQTQILWVSVMIPDNASGKYSGNVYLYADGVKTSIPVDIEVTGEPAVDHGYNEPKLFTRLSWLNSKLALQKSPTKEFTSPELNEDIISVKGHNVTIGKNGLPARITTLYNMDIKLCDTEETVAENISLNVYDAGGKLLPFDNKDISYESDDEGISWKSYSQNDYIDICISGRIEFDGYIDILPTVTCKKDIDISDIVLVIPYRPEFAVYAMGLGIRGGYAPETIDFKWDVNKHQNPLWLGGINGGMRCEFRGEDFIAPFVNIYYRHRPYHMAESFCNEGRGGIRMSNENGHSVVRAYSGERHMEAGEALDFSFDLLLTPFKELDTRKRLNTRYYHLGNASDTDVKKAKEIGANYINIHHASTFNPYINHPFIKNKELKDLIDEAHSEGLKLKIYYTVREQSDHTSELQALRSLGEEIFPKPKGDQGSILWNKENLAWFAENIGTDVIPAWKSEMDSAIISDGCSRMCNYYIEGLDWLVKNQDIDGLYIDDVAYDRITMRRARRVLDQKDGCLVDLHTWNHESSLAGCGNSLNIYMPLLPYIDSIWIGEGFAHDREKEDFWLVEMMGIPYGMSGEILPSSNNNKYRGMLFGVTTRYPWCGGSPEFLWKFIKEHDMADSEMHGFWNPETKVKTDNDKVKATMWQGDEEIVIAIASWAGEDTAVSVTLDVDGFDIKDARIPYIEGFQDEEEFTGKVMISCLGGRILTVKKSK